MSKAAKGFSLKFERSIANAIVSEKTPEKTHIDTIYSKFRCYYVNNVATSRNIVQLPKNIVELFVKDESFKVALWYSKEKRFSFDADFANGHKEILNNFAQLKTHLSSLLGIRESLFTFGLYFNIVPYQSSYEVKDRSGFIISSYDRIKSSVDEFKPLLLKKAFEEMIASASESYYKKSVVVVTVYMEFDSEETAVLAKVAL